MAMIFDLGAAPEELKQISEFMRSNGETEVPDLSELGAQILDGLTSRKHPLWRTVVGRFEEYRPTGRISDKLNSLTLGRTVRPLFETPGGDQVTGVDYFYDSEGNDTGRVGKVIEDYEDPSGAFVVGVPL